MASLRVSISILVLYLSTFILNSVLSLSKCSTYLPENHRALFIFGDSLFDTGNNDYINATTFLQANYPPYGETFFNYPTGRFSDGRIIPDFIAEYAKLPLIPPYLHPGYHDEHIYGVNFASAGAGALVETNQGLVIDLTTQANHFTEVSKQIRQKLGDVEAKQLLSRAVYLFSIGGNDYGTHFITNSNSAVVLPYPQQQFVDFVIGNITAVIKGIYNDGGRKFGFVNVGPLNCFPLLRRLVNGTTISACQEEAASALARLHNNAFPKMLQKLEKQLEGFRYSITDFYNALIEVMTNSSNYGFIEGNEACCGGGAYRGDYSCGGKRGIEEYELCNNVNEYVFFDSLHPTERAAEHFAKIMWNGNRDVEPYNLKHLFHYGWDESIFDTYYGSSMGDFEMS
ncbi:GDSL esterase/lipase 5-like [Gastrolobium bilobum]|uniref:GDSL esterase/lipase 5-like n=1 Tax=Gastrolobium bilobum TaxID=150636 RepID=UPI002AB17F62|nr:GDSL esterase/lipase 5-like [Gastrolobium bilobum]